MAGYVLNDENFEEEVMKSDVPVLVDFFAVWCGPCKMLSPIIEELAGEYDGKWKIGTCDIDDAPETSSRFGIHSVPTLLFVKNGEVVDQLFGFKSKEDLKAKLDA